MQSHPPRPTGEAERVTLEDKETLVCWLYMRSYMYLPEAPLLLLSAGAVVVEATVDVGGDIWMMDVVVWWRWVAVAAATEACKFGKTSKWCNR